MRTASNKAFLDSQTVSLKAGSLFVCSDCPDASSHRSTPAAVASPLEGLNPSSPHPRSLPKHQCQATGDNGPSGCPGLCCMRSISGALVCPPWRYSQLCWQNTLGSPTTLSSVSLPWASLSHSPSTVSGLQLAQASTPGPGDVALHLHTPSKPDTPSWPSLFGCSHPGVHQVSE